MKKVKETNASFSYQEKVTTALKALNVPLRIAEIAVIDFRYNVTVGFHKRTLPAKVARRMLKKVKEVYSEDGKWHYGFGDVT